MTAHYHEEMPMSLFHKRFQGLPRIFVTFGYNQQRRSLDDMRLAGTGFEVFVYVFHGVKSDEQGVEKKVLLRLNERIDNEWNSHSDRAAVAEMLVPLLKGGTHSEYVCADDDAWAANMLASDAQLAQQRGLEAPPPGKHDCKRNHCPYSDEQMSHALPGFLRFSVDEKSFHIALLGW